VIGDPPAPGWVKDWEFDRVQVEWIASTRMVRALEEVIPGEDARLLRVLGNPDYTARMLAFAEIERRGKAFREPLYWGLRIKDGSIPGLSRQLLTRLFDCEYCGATGVCQACKHVPQGEWFNCPKKCDHARRCVDCDGTGNWLYRRTIYNSFEERNLFPPENHAPK
jgi:hypothetical protein